MIGGYTNNGSVNNVIYLDDPSNDVFLGESIRTVASHYIFILGCLRGSTACVRRLWIYRRLALGFSSETAAHALHLMVLGLFDRYPKLQIILDHCGEGLPFFCPRIDQRMRHFQHAVLWPAKQTMTYYWNNFHVTTAGVQDEGALLDTLRVTDEDRVIFSVDYPLEEIARWFDRSEMNIETKEKIGYGNARKLLKL